MNPGEKLGRFDRLLSSRPVKKLGQGEAGGTGDIITMKTSSAPSARRLFARRFVLTPGEKRPTERKNNTRGRKERDRFYFESC